MLGDPLAALRFAPGESPFHARGVVFLAAHAYYDDKVPGGVPAVLAALEDRRLGVYFDQLFLASAWYDILPIVPISATAARLSGMEHSSLVVDNARRVARRDIPTIYRLLLRLGSPEAVALHMPKASMRYFDFGESTAQMRQPRRCECYQKGVPSELAGWFVRAVEGFTEVALGLAGAHEVRVRADPPIADGERGGAPTVILRFEMTWRD